MKTLSNPLPRLLVVVLFVFSACLLVNNANAQDVVQKLKNLHRDTKQKIHSHFSKPQTCQDNAIEQLASEIDWLENYLDQYGSVVAKQPDIWGESRLTKFRRQVEQELEKKLTHFELRDNASIIRSDIADLAAVISIGSIANSSLEAFQAGQSDEKQEERVNSTINQMTVNTSSRSEDGADGNGNGGDNGDGNGSDGDGSPDEGDEAPGPPQPPAAPTIGFDSFKELTPLTPTKTFNAKSNLEPVIELNQLKRYLDHLNQLRRVNDGDDTSDAPGYALNLVRIPVSILPGRATRRGYGAEVTVSARPILSHTLLPTTFRNLVVNDLVDQLSLQILRIAEKGQPELTVFLYENRATTNAIQQAIPGLPAEPDINKLRETIVEVFASDLMSVTTNRRSDIEIFAIAFGRMAQYSSGLQRALNAVGEKDLAKELLDINAKLKLIYQNELIKGLPLLGSQYSDIVRYVYESQDEKKINDKLRAEIAKVSTDQAVAKIEKQIDDATEQKTVAIRASLFEQLDQEQTKIVTSLENELAELKKKNEELFPDGIEALEVSRIAGLSDQQLLQEVAKLRDGVSNAENNVDEDVSRAFRNAFEGILGKRESVRSELDKQIEQESEAISKVYEPNLSSEIKKQQNAVMSSAKTELQKEVSDLLRELGPKLQLITQKIAETNSEEFRRNVSASKSRLSRFPISPAVARHVYGDEILRPIAVELKKSYEGRYVVWNDTKAYEGQIHLLDTQQFLQEHFDAAYGVLIDPKHRQLLVETIEGNQYGKPLAEMAKTGDSFHLPQLRSFFVNQLTTCGVDEKVARYCWCIAIEMATLNDRLNRDVHEHALRKGSCGCRAGCNLKYYLPLPNCSEDRYPEYDPDFYEAAEQFCCYVKCRWPIHVFTIDPINQEQNVSDASVVRRELSIAAALAFTSGKINLSQLTRFQRQFQEDIATVGLNRTQVGFVHSRDTFGWRFTPRVQTRRPQGNLRALGETMFGRRADASWREAALEPGMRECTAIVLMPSFVPYCDFDVRTNWFQIAKPTHSDISMKQTMKLSRSITTMRCARKKCVQCANLYRPGEVDRLIRRVDQLERELPLQSMRSQVPFENTLGGFELFSNGQTDLGPQLSGWYGAPGIVIGFNAIAGDEKKRTFNRPGDTDLFLVGDNLSLHETKIIAGGIAVKNEDAELISRQVIRVKIPDEAQMVDIEGRRYVAVYCATPYGVTNHLHIPVVANDIEAANAKSLEDLEKKLLEKIAETPYKWSKKSSIEIEALFGLSDKVCRFQDPRVLYPNEAFTLKSGIMPTSLSTADKRPFALIGILRDAKKKQIGKPFPIVDTLQRFDNAGEWKAKAENLVTLQMKNVLKPA